MTRPGSSSAASRLCSQCGMCCNGVMFRMVQLQPEDSVRELAALGLKIKRKHGERCIMQPCPAHAESQCTIYASRPVRCRRFECLQVRRLAAGEITETMAMAAIRDAQQGVEQVRERLRQSGEFQERKSLTGCYEHALAEPLDPSAEEAVVARRRGLIGAMRSLQALLNRDFRVEPLEMNADGEVEAEG